MNTRVALGLTSAAYAAADMIAPVTESNADWERQLGVDPDRIRVIPNGIPELLRDSTPLPSRPRGHGRPDRPAEGRADDVARRG